MTYNQMALHTTAGCFAANGTNQTGKPGPADCAPKTGCTVVSARQNSRPITSLTHSRQLDREHPEQLWSGFLR